MLRKRYIEALKLQNPNGCAVISYCKCNVNSQRHLEIFENFLMPSIICNNLQMSFSDVD